MGACSSKGVNCGIDNTVISLHGKNVADILAATAIALEFILNTIQAQYFTEQPNQQIEEALKILDLLEGSFLGLNSIFDSVEDITLLPKVVDLNGDGKISFAEIATSISNDAKGILFALCGYIQTVLKKIQNKQLGDENVQKNVADALEYMKKITAAINFVGQGLDAVKAAQQASAMTTQFTTASASTGIPLSPSKEQIDLQQALSESSPKSSTAPALQ